MHYTGVKWSDGTVFDSSWEAGAPATFATTGVVEGFKQALEGQTVGSQVLVVIPPAFGYGAAETTTSCRTRPSSSSSTSSEPQAAVAAQ